MTQKDEVVIKLAFTCQQKLSSFSFLPPSPSRSIKRIIFSTLVKPNVNEKGEKQMDTISTSQALQISGRAGRLASSFSFSR